MTDKNAKNENSKIRIMTFFPPFIILVAFLVLSLVDQETFLGVINNINNWIIKNLGWAASILALAIVIVAVVAMFSKFGDVRIGGEDAKPELSNFSWFTIALTTTMAAGVLFWGPGEPIAHYAYPPTELYEICHGNHVPSLDDRSILYVYGSGGCICFHVLQREKAVFHRQ